MEIPLWQKLLGACFAILASVAIAATVLDSPTPMEQNSYNTPTEKQMKQPGYNLTKENRR